MVTHPPVSSRLELVSLRLTHLATGHLTHSLIAAAMTSMTTAQQRKVSLNILPVVMPSCLLCWLCQYHDVLTLPLYLRSVCRLPFQVLHSPSIRP